MRILADENFPKAIVDWLREQGSELVWARTAFPGWKDLDLLDLAESEKRVVITLDKDFWQIALQRKVPLVNAGVVLVRIHPATSGNLLPFMQNFVRAATNWTGYVSILAEDGIQMVPSKRSSRQP